MRCVFSISLIFFNRLFLGTVDKPRTVSFGNVLKDLLQFYWETRTTPLYLFIVTYIAVRSNNDWGEFTSRSFDLSKLAWCKSNLVWCKSNLWYSLLKWTLIHWFNETSSVVGKPRFLSEVIFLHSLLSKSIRYQVRFHNVNTFNLNTFAYQFCCYICI